MPRDGWGQASMALCTQLGNWQGTGEAQPRDQGACEVALDRAGDSVRSVLYKGCSDPSVEKTL